MKENVYLDYAATTPVDSRVLQKMEPYFNQIYGNPSSVHYFGQKADAAVESSRAEVAKILSCRPEEIIFTSCGTESDNLALRGTAFQAQKSRGANHLLLSPVEHHAVSHTAEQLANFFGFEVEYLPTDSAGLINPEDVRSRLRKSTALVSVIYANNEIGTVNPIAEIGKICREAEIPFHTDAVQAGGYLDLNVDNLRVDLMSLGAHKFYGPKGVGVLYRRQPLALLPMQTGGSQEYGLRAGTQNVAYIVGFAEALRIAQSEKTAAAANLSRFRDYLIGNVLEIVPDSYLTGHPSDRLPNHSSFVFDHVDGNHLLTMLDIAGFSCSSGSACKTGNPEPSEVLTALGINEDLALGSLRITLGRWTNKNDIKMLLETLPELIIKARAISS